MEAARLHKLVAKLDTENVNEQHVALSAIPRQFFTDVSIALSAISDAQHRTGYSFAELIKIIQKRWPKPEEGWRGMSGAKKFAAHRMLVTQDWLSDHERHRLIELNDRACLAPGNPVSPDDEAFLEAILRKAKREGLRI